MSIAALKAMPLPTARIGPALASMVAGIDFPGPLGPAPGYDKSDEVPNGLLRIGFGFFKVGRVSPRAQAGNLRPRLFQLAEDCAVISRMGFKANVWFPLPSPKPASLEPPIADVWPPQRSLS